MPCNSSWLVGKKAPGYLDIEGVLWSAHVIFQPFLNIYSILHKIWLVNKWRAESIQRQLPLVPDVVHHRVPGLFSHAERALTGLNPWAVRVSSLPSKVEHSFSLYLQIVIKLTVFVWKLMHVVCPCWDAAVEHQTPWFWNFNVSICFSTQRIEMM